MPLRRSVVHWLAGGYKHCAPTELGIGVRRVRVWLKNGSSPAMASVTLDSIAHGQNRSSTTDAVFFEAIKTLFKVSFFTYFTGLGWEDHGRD
jgi:hypothetical protein